MAKKSLDTLTMRELQHELRRRQRMVGSRVRGLTLRRNRLVERLTEVDEELSKLGARAGIIPAGRKRPHNELKLGEALAKLLKGQTMAVTKITEAVQEAGYATVSPNFRTIVNQTLIKDSRFKRVGRGLYTAK